MNIATNGDLFQLIDRDIDESVERLENLARFLDDHSSVFLVKRLLAALPLHH